MKRRNAWKVISSHGLLLNTAVAEERTWALREKGRMNNMKKEGKKKE